MESGNVSAGNWRWLRCRVEPVAEETAQGWRRAGEGRGHAVGGWVRIGKDQEGGKKRFRLNFVGESAEGD